MRNYLALLQDILENGSQKTDRTGTGTLSVFGRQLRFDLQAGFPLVTTKKLHWASIAHELLWFLSGDTNIRYLQQNNVRIWNEWADADGNLGRVYGAQWRAWRTADNRIIDQMADLVAGIKKDPHSRRHLVSAWNVGEIAEMALPPCHLLFQFYVEGNKLSCQFYMRSSDVFLGLPFNIASYALLTHLIAQQCDLIPHELIYTGGDVHLYLNHQNQARLQLSRTPYPLPMLKILRKPASLFEYTYDDFEIMDYQAHPSIQAKIAV